MEATEIVEQTGSRWKVQTLIIGSVVGALVGLGAAFLLTQRAEQKGAKVSMSPGKGLQLGVLVAGLLRSILSMGED